MAPNGGATPQRKTRRRRLPGDWQPSRAARAYAAEHGIDPERSAERFRLWAQAEGRRLADWDARYMPWLANEKPAPPEQKPTPTPPRRTPRPHKHSAGCGHVQALLAPYEHALDRTNAIGFGTSPRAKAAWAVADALNQGGTRSQALQAAGLASPAKEPGSWALKPSRASRRGRAREACRADGGAIGRVDGGYDASSPGLASRLSLARRLPPGPHMRACPPCFPLSAVAHDGPDSSV